MHKHESRISVVGKAKNWGEVWSASGKLENEIRAAKQRCFRLWNLIPARRIRLPIPMLKHYGF